MKPQSEDAGKIYQEFDNGVNYLNLMNIEIQKYIDYFQGKQWPKATELTKNLPRPVLNVAKFIARNKRSAVLNVPVKVVFTAEEGTDTRILNDFYSYITKQLKISDLDRKTVNKGTKTGTYIQHFYWDIDAVGLDATQEGNVQGEIIDPRDIVFANPAQQDEQKQRYIIIRTRMEVDAAKEMLKKIKGNVDLIVRDEVDFQREQLEQDGTDRVYVYTKYYKRDGEVFYQKCTKDAMLTGELSLTPKSNAEIIKKGMKKSDPEVDATPTETPGKKVIKKERKFDLYPIIVGSWEERDGSIFGIGEVEELIENQNILNRDLAYHTKARRDNSLGGWRAKEGALQGQEITNAPDQIITDYSVGNNWGIDKLPTGNVPNDNLQFVDLFVSMLRTVTGATEVMSGEVLGKNMSGAAIAQLQSQAQQPIKDYRDRFWDFKVKQAQVLLRYFLHFYNGEVDFNRKNDADADEKVVFNPQMFIDKNIDCVAEAGQGATYNELSTVTALDTLMQSKTITPEFYIKALPPSVLGNKDDLVKYMEQEKKSQMTMLMQQNTELQQQLLNAANVITEQSKVVNDAKRIIDENMSLKAEMLNIVAANAELSRKAQEYFTDAQAFAHNIQGTMGSKVETPKK